MDKNDLQAYIRRAADCHGPIFSYLLQKAYTEKRCLVFEDAEGLPLRLSVCTLKDVHQSYFRNKGTSQALRPIEPGGLRIGIFKITDEEETNTRKLIDYLVGDLDPRTVADLCVETKGTEAQARRKLNRSFRKQIAGILYSYGESILPVLEDALKEEALTQVKRVIFLNKDINKPVHLPIDDPRLTSFIKSAEGMLGYSILNEPIKDLTTESGQRLYYVRCVVSFTTVNGDATFAWADLSNADVIAFEGTSARLNFVNNWKHSSHKIMDALERYSNRSIIILRDQLGFNEHGILPKDRGPARILPFDEKGRELLGIDDHDFREPLTDGSVRVFVAQPAYDRKGYTFSYTEFTTKDLLDIQDDTYILPKQENVHRHTRTCGHVFHFLTIEEVIETYQKFKPDELETQRNTAYLCGQFFKEDWVVNVKFAVHQQDWKINAVPARAIYEHGKKAYEGFAIPEAAPPGTIRHAVWTSTKAVNQPVFVDLPVPPEVLEYAKNSYCRIFDTEESKTEFCDALMKKHPKVPQLLRDAYQRNALRNTKDIDSELVVYVDFCPGRIQDNIVKLEKIGNIKERFDGHLRELLLGLDSHLAVKLVIEGPVTIGDQSRDCIVQNMRVASEETYTEIERQQQDLKAKKDDVQWFKQSKGSKFRVRPIVQGEQFGADLSEGFARHALVITNIGRGRWYKFKISRPNPSCEKNPWIVAGNHYYQVEDLVKILQDTHEDDIRLDIRFQNIPHRDREYMKWCESRREDALIRRYENYRNAAAEFKLDLHPIRSTTYDEYFINKSLIPHVKKAGYLASTTEAVPKIFTLVAQWVRSDFPIYVPTETAITQALNINLNVDNRVPIAIPYGVTLIDVRNKPQPFIFDSWLELGYKPLYLYCHRVATDAFFEVNAEERLNVIKILGRDAQTLQPEDRTTIEKACISRKMRLGILMQCPQMGLFECDFMEPSKWTQWREQALFHQKSSNKDSDHEVLANIHNLFSGLFYSLACRPPSEREPTEHLKIDNPAPLILERLRPVTLHDNQSLILRIRPLKVNTGTRGPLDKANLLFVQVSRREHVRNLRCGKGKKDRRSVTIPEGKTHVWITPETFKKYNVEQVKYTPVDPYDENDMGTPEEMEEIRKKIL